MSPHHFQVHPEGKFVVDVDKNIDINDVSIIVVIIIMLEGRGLESFSHSCPYKS